MADKTPDVYYLARCRRCEFEIPFATEADRDEWAEIHGSIDDPFDGTRHLIDSFVAFKPKSTCPVHGGKA